MTVQVGGYLGDSQRTSPSRRGEHLGDVVGEQGVRPVEVDSSSVGAFPGGSHDAVINS